MAPRRKLIEVSLPLEAINAASAREKSIRHGHPSTLHLWWARRPLAACRAVLFSQLVDDPSSWPERFPTADAQEAERKRLHDLIARMVPWEASNNEAILNEARFEIARSVAWGLGEEPPTSGDPAAVLAYLQTKAPPVYDPFCGGGSIPLEAQRLGLRAYGSDLNPVAVLISKALVEIPPKFAGRPPVNPEAQAKLKAGGAWQGKGAEGLAEDVRWYGRWMRDEAEKRIGHLYPKAKLPGGGQAKVIAWLWARTVRSPDPAAKGAMVPLVSSFMLSTKEGKKAWVEPVRDASAPDGYRFEVRSGELAKADEERLKKGTKTSAGTFRCLFTGTPITETWNRAEGKAGRLGSRLMAIVAEGQRGRIYLPPSPDHEQPPTNAASKWEPEGGLYEKALGFRVPGYGFTRWAQLFTPRQLAALTTFTELASDVQETIATHARTAGLSDGSRLRDGGIGSAGYADAISTYLALGVSRFANLMNNMCQWRNDPGKQHVGHMFTRQAIAMVWDYAEGNPFGESAGSWNKSVLFIPKVMQKIEPSAGGNIAHIDAAQNGYGRAVFSTDPPYYDNVGYADLSDFFYIWLRCALQGVWPDLFRLLLTPKDNELVATPDRFGGKNGAEKHFMAGMFLALRAMREAASDDVPLTIYYAFKQSEAAEEGTSSAGWSAFVQAVLDVGLMIDGTWPLRTELANRTRVIGSNALASSVVLVCRKRPSSAVTITRAEFLRALKRELPDALVKIRAAGIQAVDFQQAAIGPGMGVFSRYARVLEADDSPMTVRTALALINTLIEELASEQDGAYDTDTQAALAWFQSFGYAERPSGDLINLATAKNTSLDGLRRAQVFATRDGKARLVSRGELPQMWSRDDDRLTLWQAAQHVARTLDAETGGIDAAARLLRGLGARGHEILPLVYRLYQIADQRKEPAEALIWNRLATEWPTIEARAGEIAEAEPRGERTLFDL
jgi:Adenine-specific DNA methylase containing a Zn-ribbon